MSLVFNGKYDGFSTAVGGWGLKDVEISTATPNLSGLEPGKIWYIKQEDSLIMEITVEPYYQVLAGGILGWSFDFNILTGGDSLGSTDNEFAIFSTIQLNEEEGYNNLDVYRNGLLMENSPTGDYTVDKEGENFKLVFNYDVPDNDRVVMVISSRPSMNNYVTKFSLKDFLQKVDLTIEPISTDYYNLGSDSNIFNSLYVHRILGPQNNKLVLRGNVEIDGDLVVGGTEHTTTNTNISDESLVIHYSDPGVDGDSSLEVRRHPRIEGTKEKTEVTLKSDQNGSLDGKYWTLSSALNEKLYYVWYRVTPEEAKVEGTNDLSSGYDWVNYEDDFVLSVNSINHTISLQQNHSDIDSLVGEINNVFSSQSILTIAEADGNNFIIKTSNLGASQSIEVVSGSAATKLGLPSGVYSGVDGSFSFTDIDLGGTALPTGETGLQPGNTYNFTLVVGTSSQNTSIPFVAESRAYVLGTADLSAGYDWLATPQEFIISVNGSNPETITLNEQTTDLTTTISMMNTKFSSAGLTDVEAYQDGSNMGFRTIQVGSNQNITIQEGLDDALPTIGLSAGSYDGTDNDDTTYDSLLSKLNSRTTGVDWGLNNGNIRITNEVADSSAISIIDGTNGLLSNLIDIQDPSLINQYVGNEAEPAIVANTIDLSGGVDFMNHNQILIINDVEYTLDQKKDTISEIVDYVNTFVPQDLEAYDIGGQYFGIKSVEVGIENSFSIGLGSANDTFGFFEDVYTGVGHLNIEDVDPVVSENPLMVEIDRDDNANSVALKTFNIINPVEDFNTTILGASLTIENIEMGTAVDVVDGGADVSISILNQGSITYYPRERDSKIIWDDTDHSWKLKYGEDGEFISKIITEDHNKALYSRNAERLINNPLLTLSGGLSGSVNIDGETDITLNATVLGEEHDHTSISGSAARLTTPRIISLSDDVLGSVSFDGSSNVSISANVKALDGVAVHAGATAPTGTAQINIEGYFYATRVYNAVYNDLAEFMDKAEEAEPGDVMIQTAEGLMKSMKNGDHRVVGVYSDSFGYALGAENSESKIPIGISGTVWVKVKGKFKIGDMVISTKDGFAKKANLFYRVFKRDALIGKILKDNSENGRVKILII